MREGVRLQLLLGPGRPASRDLVEAVTSVQVTVSARSRSGFQITFAVGPRTRIWREVLPAGALDPAIRMILVVLVHATATVLIDGVVTRHDMAPAAEPGVSTLTLTGEDLTVLMDLDATPRTHPGLSADKRVTALCSKYAKYGIVSDARPLPAADVPNATDRIPGQTTTDLAYVRTLADAVGYTFYLEPGPTPGASTAYWGPDDRRGPPQPALTVGLGAASNVDALSFALDGQSASDLSASIGDPDSKQMLTVNVPKPDVLRPPLAARPVPALRRRPLPATAKLTTVQAAARGLGTGARDADAVTGQGRLDVGRYGHILKARRLVGVRGAGVTYDGTYYVTSVTHELKPGSYTQGFQLTRDGLVSLTQSVPT